MIFRLHVVLKATELWERWQMNGTEKTNERGLRIERNKGKRWDTRRRKKER